MELLDNLKNKRDKMFVQKVSEIGYKALHDKNWSDKDTENEFLKFIDQACSETAEVVAREIRVTMRSKSFEIIQDMQGKMAYEGIEKMTESIDEITKKFNSLKE